MEQHTEISATNRGSVAEGKEKLREAIENKSVEGIRDALVYLSTTSLAWEVHEDHGEDSADEGSRKHMKIDVNFDIRVPSDHLFRYYLPNFHTTNVMPACIGPGKIRMRPDECIEGNVYTEMVRCLLTPQTIEIENDGSSTTAIIISTNAGDKNVVDVAHPVTSKDGKVMRGSTPLSMAVEYGNRELTKLLLEHGPADPNGPCPRCTTPLTKACLMSDLYKAQLLLEHGADPNFCTNDGLTPLIRASRDGDLEMVQLLLLSPDDKGNIENVTLHQNQWGTNIHHYDQQSMNALMHACAENNEDIVRFLLSGGIRNAKHNHSLQNDIVSYANDYKVDPALWYASAHGSAGIVKFLMDECQANPTYRKDPTVYSSTPLEEASQWGHASTVKVLLERSGSDPRTPSGKRARKQAERSGHKKVVQLLDEWTERHNSIEKGSFPLGLLPLLLSRKNDCAHRILCNHAGGIVCCRHNERKCNKD